MYFTGETSTQPIDHCVTLEEIYISRSCCFKRTSLELSAIEMIWRLLLLAGNLAVSIAFTTTTPQSQPHPGRVTAWELNSYAKDSHHEDSSRRKLIASSLSFLGLVEGILPSNAADEIQPSQRTDGEGVVMYKTPSGLKYIELEPGRSSESTPRYGQVCIISYKAYLKLPNAKEKQQFDSSGPFVMKHGNGRMISGLDEGLHTMRPGELRRIIIPPKLGFVQSGLGPLPRFPWDRRRLNNLLDKMVQQQGGNLVYDVRLEKVIDSEADQGYYEDAELSPEELEELQNKLMRRAGGSQS